MLTGRFQLAAPGDEAARQDGGRARLRRASRRPARMPHAGRAAPPGCPADDARARGPLSRPDPDGQGLPPAGRRRARRAGPGRAEQGPDADDPALTLDVWRERIRRHPGELKNLLRNQSFVAGIGNAYSDEILHAARLLPFRKRSSLATEEVDALYAATRTTLADAIAVLREARAADVREAGPRLPRRPRQGRAAVPALRHAGSPRSAPAGSSPRTAEAASADRRRPAAIRPGRDARRAMARRAQAMR